MSTHEIKTLNPVDKCETLKRSLPVWLTILDLDTNWLAASKDRSAVTIAIEKDTQCRDRLIAYIMIENSNKHPMCAREAKASEYVLPFPHTYWNSS